MLNKKPWYKKLFENKDRNVYLTCLGVALLFWFTKALSEEYVHDYRFTIDYQLPENVNFVEPARQHVEARLSGQGWELFKASLRRHFSHIPVPVVRDAVTRTEIITAIYTHLSDYDIAVREVDADVINLQTDIVIDRAVPVILNATVQLAEGFMYTDSVQITPSQIVVSGPASLVEGLENILTEELESIELSSDFEVQLDLLFPESEYLTFTPEEVTVTAGVDEELKACADYHTGSVGRYNAGHNCAGINYGRVYHSKEVQIRV